jgi:hypothetical protein
MPLSIGMPAAKHSQLKITLFVDEITRRLKDSSALSGTWRTEGTAPPHPA